MWHGGIIAIFIFSRFQFYIASLLIAKCQTHCLKLCPGVRCLTVWNSIQLSHHLNGNESCAGNWLCCECAMWSATVKLINHNLVENDLSSPCDSFRSFLANVVFVYLNVSAIRLRMKLGNTELSNASRCQCHRFSPTANVINKFMRDLVVALFWLRSLHIAN